MQDLADAVHLSQSALSRLIGRLETRRPRRSRHVLRRTAAASTRITDEGRARCEAAQPTHRAVLADSLD